ncbi:MAG TPA: phosphate acyltransferase PlsX [Anaerolineales bacterium]|nr:phosphate acyltransferase PlsX [Anaerolineales bacterium]HRQ91255.1 phosphate acyltransferase PlsX [Anaerolineales bacterium]
MRIVLDAMGSDNHPAPEVEAAVEYARQYGETLYLVGDEPRLRQLLGSRTQGIELVHAPDVFEMTDHISHGSLRKMQNSMGVGMDLIKDGKADAFVSAGNTGGQMAIALARLGRLRGVKRPALTVFFPVKGGRCAVLDIGANAECKPEYLVQFALLGSVYVEKVLGVKNPRIGLLSNGEEAGKGNELVKATHPLLESSGLNFIGNVEGKELFGGEADVVVTDGFTGNVVMKSAEAVAKLITDRLREEITSSLITKIGGLLARPAFRGLRKELDPAEVGAAPMLGINGLVFVAHGRSDARALLSAMRLARHSVEVNLLSSLSEAIETGLGSLPSGND